MAEKRKVKARAKRLRKAGPVEPPAAAPGPAVPELARPPARRVGRRIEIDCEELEELACLQCTVGEAAAWFGVSASTLTRRLKEPPYREAWSRGAGKGRLGLRRAQLHLAEKNATMAIFLGKQILGQNDQKREPNGDRDRAAKAADRSARDEIARRIAGIASRDEAAGNSGGADGGGSE